MNEEAVRLIDEWTDKACTEIDVDFKWVDAFEFIFAEYESEKFMGLYTLPDDSQIFPMDVKQLREYAANLLNNKFYEARESIAETTLSAMERTPGLK